MLVMIQVLVVPVGVLTELLEQLPLDLVVVEELRLLVESVVLHGQLVAVLVKTVHSVKVAQVVLTFNSETTPAVVVAEEAVAEEAVVVRL